MNAMRFTIMAFCVAALAAGASCGRKGNPIVPPTAAELLEEDAMVKVRRDSIGVDSLNDDGDTDPGY